MHDPNEHLELAFPAPKRTITLLWRALTLRCPNCGRGPVMRHWFRMREACGHCGIKIERGESDYFIGSMMMNLVLGEFVFAIIFVTVLILTWPTPPWNVLEIAAPIGALGAPFVMFPFSKLVWLGLDLVLRPEKTKD
jgi:uncharacterized protein (DUF983 family)